jgi:hypothetical protein
MTYRYRFISDHHAGYGVTRLCRVLAVPRRQGYYEWLAAQPARRQRTEAEDRLADQIRGIHADHRGRVRVAAGDRGAAPPGPAGQPQAGRADHARAREGCHLRVAPRRAALFARLCPGGGRSVCWLRRRPRDRSLKAPRSTAAACSVGMSGCPSVFVNQAVEDVDAVDVARDR